VDWGDGSSQSVLVHDQNSRGTAQYCHTYASAGSYTVTLPDADLLSYFEANYQHITAWTGDAVYLQSLYLYGNWLRDLPATALPYQEMPRLNTVYVEYNCIDPDLQDVDNAQRISNYYSSSWQYNQSLCGEVSYNPAKPAS
jgi:hypothetical protein